MNEMMLVVLAYLLGSIPTSIWVSKAVFGIDIRDYGSGNPGATNTFRVLGSKWGTFVMIADITKGVIATSLYILIPFYLQNELARTNFMIVLGLAAVLGHIFPIWADFKGGKGVATISRDGIGHSAHRGAHLHCCVFDYFVYNQICFPKFYVSKPGLYGIDFVYFQRKRNLL
jgi:acyl-phosphate glycerol 3-phosphate acyltransferase